MGSLAPSPSATLPRLADPVAVLSLAIDLATGQPLEHTLRTCLLSLELARRSGVGADRLDEVYYVALLRHLGATAAAADTAAHVGDDVAFTAGMGPAFLGSEPERLRAALRSSGTGDEGGARLLHRAHALGERTWLRRSVASQCEVAAALGTRLGLSAGVVDTLAVAFERWDGRGVPGTRGGEEVPASVRVATVARDVELWRRIGGPRAAAAVVDARAGRGYDPTVAAAFLLAPDEVLAVAEVEDAWDAVLAAEPAPVGRIAPGELDTVLSVLGDFADLKSPWLRGHSAGVARLVGRAAEAAALDPARVERLRHAGLVHDVGRVAVANTVWDHAGGLGPDAREQVREHPYLAERLLARSSLLAPLGRLAAAHHERSDGSGYPIGIHHRDVDEDEGLEISLLAASDTYHALVEARAHRPPTPPPRAAEQLVREVAAGRLPSTAVDAVLDAVGREPPPRWRARWPNGLTEREVDVLRLVVRGASHREMADRLGLTTWVVDDHVTAVYEKLGAHTRAGAALLAMQHGLLA